MEENVSKKSKTWLYIIIALVVVVIGIVVGYCIHNNNLKPVDNNNNENQKYLEEDYLKILDNKKVLRSELNLSKHAKVASSVADDENGIVFLDVVEPDFQFETHYLLCFNKDGKLISDIRDFKDSDNDNNRYKYNGKFEYNKNTNILSFYTNLFLGESDYSTGEAFNGKSIDELTSSEKKVIANYSDLVKYDYKYENGKLSFVQKKEMSKLKDNAYFKDLLNN